MPSNRIVITGIGAITPIGTGVEEYWKNLVAGKSGFGLITRFDTTLYPVKVAAEVKGFDPTQFMHIKRADRTSLCTQFAMAATRMAVEAAKLDMTKEKPETVGVSIATSGMIAMIADVADTLKTKPSRIDPLFINKIAASMVPCQVGLEFGMKGPNTSVNSACASGNDAIGTALNHLRLGHAEVMVAGGAEANINPLTLACLGRVGALSKEIDPLKACRPFDMNRSGMVLGEGAGILILETYEHAKRRGADIIAELAGAGWSFDAYNDTAPDPAIEAVAVRQAISDAGLTPDDVDYINAHGTSTKLNDAGETQAIKLAFGERAYKIPISSNKSMIGHLACAASAAEAVAAVMTVKEDVIPPTIAYETPDPECDLDYVPNKARQCKVNVCLSTSFGMGGQNACIVVKKFKE